MTVQYDADAAREAAKLVAEEKAEYSAYIRNMRRDTTLMVIAAPIVALLMWRVF